MRFIQIFKRLGLFLFAVISIVQGQSTGSIHGTVIDAKTKEPLPGVNIQVLDYLRGASSNAYGKFFIENLDPGTYRLEFSFIGYTIQTRTDIIVTASKPAILNMQLTEQLYETDEITVTAGYFVEETMTQPSIIGLSREEIRRFPGGFEDVVRTVSTLPGVAINTSGGRNDLLVRGGGPSENLFIINNIEVPNINHFGTQGSSSGALSFINLDFVDNVSFSTGGFPAQFGDKMSSTLSLNMSRGRDDRIGSKILISATQFGINFEGPIGQKGDFIVSARKSYLDLIFKAAGLPFIPVYTDYNFLMHYDISPKDKLFLLGLAAIDRVDRNQSSLENRIKNAGIMDNSQNQLISGLDYRRLLSRGYFDLVLNANRYDFNFKQFDEFEDAYFTSNTIESEYGLKAIFYWSFIKQFSLSGGMSTKMISNNNTTVFADTIFNRSGIRIAATELDIEPSININQSQFKHSGFFTLDFVPLALLNFQIGLRSDYYSFLSQPLYWSPRFLMRINLSKKLSFKSSAGIYHQSPAYVWTAIPANRNLKALKNTMYILGLDYLVVPDIRVSVETFYKSYTNLPGGLGVNDYLVITNTGTGFGGRDDNFQSFGFFPMVSRATGNAFGFEFLLQKKYSQIPCYGQISLSYSKSRFVANNGTEYPGQYDQTYILNIAGGYKYKKNWEFSTKYRLFSGVPFTPLYRPTENLVNPGFIENLPAEYLSDRLPTQGVLDFRIDRYFNFAKWRLVTFIDIQNILNKKVEVRPQYDFWEDEISQKAGIGILPSIGISAEF